MNDEKTSSEDMDSTVPRPYWVSLGALERGDRFRLMESDEIWFVVGFAGDEMAGKHYVDARRERDGRLKRFPSTVSVIPCKERALCRSAALVPKAELEAERERLRQLEVLRVDQLGTKNKSLSIVREKLHDALRRAKKAEEESDFFQKQLEELVATNGALRNELTGTRVALKDVRTAHSETVAGWQRTSEDNERLKREIHTMNRELSGWRAGAQRDATDAEINLLRGRLDEANAKRATYKREIRRLQAALLRQRGEWKSEKVEGLEMRVKTLEQKRRDQLSDELDRELKKLRTSAKET